MMILSKKINIRPTSSVYATYKRLSYQPWTAIAEFVDNSTQSFYDHKDELMAQKYAKGLNITIRYIEDAVEGDRLEITDDAYGMEWTDFQRAVVLDRPPKNTSGRNEFGMGLKTAACWFGSLWSVESTQLNSTTKYYTEINIDELGKYKTEEIDVQEESVSKKDHFTKIVIKRLNKRIVGPRTIGKVKELLSSIYREDLRTGLVRITYNGNALQYKEAPVYTDDDSKTWKKDISFTVNKDDLDDAVAVLDANQARLGFAELHSERNIAKLSIVGAGMMSNPGVAAKMFESLYNEGVNINMISTSEIRVTVLINEKDGVRAMNAVHDTFGLAD